MAIIQGIQPEQQNVVVNPALQVVFFENQNLTYNYRTDQWSRIPVSAPARYFETREADQVLGYFEFENIRVHVGYSSSPGTASAATATVVTGEVQLNPDSRSIVDGVTPRTDGGSLSSLRIGVRDLLSDSVTFSTGTAVHSRTGQSNFRSGANTPEGRYHRAEFVFTGGFTTLSGADFDFFPAGKA